MKKFKKSLCLVLSCLMLISVFVITPISASAKAKKPKLSKKSVSITRGKTYKLKLKNAKAKKVKWTSSKKSIATVKKGKITTKKAGKATITAKYKGKKYKCKLTVKGKIINTSNTFKVYKNGTIKIWLVNGYGIKVACKKWSTSNSGIASINSSGIITGKRVGTVTVTGVTNDGDYVRSKVNVLDPFKALRDYIVSYGDTNSYGNYYIKDTYTTSDKITFYCYIYFDPSKNQFIFRSENDEDNYDDDDYYLGYNNYIVQMPINYGGSNNTSVIWAGEKYDYLYDEDYDDYYFSEDEDWYFESKANITPGNFTSSTNLNFAVSYGEASLDFVNKWGNSDLKNSMYGWNNMLNNINSNGLTLCLANMGFVKFK